MVLDGEALHCVGLWQCFNLHIGYRYTANADAAQLDGGGGSPIFEGGAYLLLVNQRCRISDPAAFNH